MSDQPPSPGWYPDPSGTDPLRWWDGQSWTDHVHEHPDGAKSHGDTAAVLGTPLPGGQIPREALAGIGQRFLALLADGVVIWIIASIAAALSGAELTVNDDGQIVDLTVGPMLFTFAAVVLYPVLFEGGRYGQTIGKWLVGISVRQPDGSAGLGRGRVLLRTVVKFTFSGAFFGLGYLWAILDPHNRSLHDMAGGTRVVRLGTRIPFRALLAGAWKS